MLSQRHQAILHGVLPVRKILKQSSRCPLSMEADTPRTLYAPCALSLGTLYKLSKEVQAHSPAQRLALLFKKNALLLLKNFHFGCQRTRIRYLNFARVL